MKNLLKHFVEQSVIPDGDSQQWLAYVLLQTKYPKLTYLSFDGYHCHGIADYSEDKMFYWQDRYKGGILNWREKIVILPLYKDFCDMSTFEIVNIWMDLCGETDETKKAFIESFK